MKEMDWYWLSDSDFKYRIFEYNETQRAKLRRSYVKCSEETNTGGYCNNSPRYLAVPLNDQLLDKKLCKLHHDNRPTPSISGR